MCVCKNPGKTREVCVWFEKNIDKTSDVMNANYCVLFGKSTQTNDGTEDRQKYWVAFGGDGRKS